MTFISETGDSGHPTGLRGTTGPLRMTPGRWVAVALAVPVTLALIGWIGFSLVASIAKGSYPFSYAFHVHDGQVAVSVNTGNVTLQVAPGSGTARLTGIVEYGLFRPDISEQTTSAGANVGVGCSSANLYGNCGASATLDVPARTAVTLWSNGGDIGVSGFAGDLTLSTDGGNLNAGNLGGSLQILTGGGDLTANALSGNSVQVSTEGGNVTGNYVSSPQVTVLSGGGDVTLVFTRPPASLQITSQGGNITVVLPHGDTRYAIATPGTDGGNVSYPSSLFSSTSNNAIMANSGGGDITITEAS